MDASTSNVIEELFSLVCNGGPDHHTFLISLRNKIIHVELKGKTLLLLNEYNIFLIVTDLIGNYTLVHWVGIVVYIIL